MVEGSRVSESFRCYLRPQALFQAKEEALSNVIEFKRPPEPKEPKKPNPVLRKGLIWLGVAVALVAIWAWFHFTGG